MLILFLIYKIVLRKFKKYKIIKYLKNVLSEKIFLFIIISAMISNLYVLQLNHKYDVFYQKPPDIINAQAVIIRRLYRKRIQKYVYNKN